MIVNLMQFYRSDKQAESLTRQAIAIEKDLTAYLKEVLGDKLVAIRTMHYEGSGKFFYTWNISERKLSPEDVLLLHIALEKQFVNVSDVRNLTFQLFVEWTL